MSQSDRRVAAGAAVLFGGLAIAVCLFFAGAVFGLNGEQWAWWTWASWVGGLLVLVGAGFGALQVAGSDSRSDHAAGVAGALLGAALLVSSLLLMAHSYSDPYSGDLFWPHALAVLALVGLALVVVGLLWRVRRDSVEAR